MIFNSSVTSQSPFPIPLSSKKEDPSVCIIFINLYTVWCYLYLFFTPFLEKFNNLICFFFTLLSIDKTFSYNYLSCNSSGLFLLNVKVGCFLLTCPALQWTPLNSIFLPIYPVPKDSSACNSSQPPVAYIYLNNTALSADSDSAISRTSRNMLHWSGSKTLACGTLLMTSFSCEKGLLTVLFAIFHSVIYTCNYLFLGSVSFRSFWWLTSPNSLQKSMVSIPGCISLSHEGLISISVGLWVREAALPLKKAHMTHPYYSIFMHMLVNSNLFYSFH